MKNRYLDKVYTFANSLVDKLRIGKVSANSISETKELEIPTTVELDPTIYKELLQQANKQNTTVPAIVYSAIEYYRTTNVTDGEMKISIDQKDKNPLLLLDGIAISSSQNRKIKQDKEVVEIESGKKPKW